MGNLLFHVIRDTRDGSNKGNYLTFCVCVRVDNVATPRPTPPPKQS